MSAMLVIRGLLALLFSIYLGRSGALTHEEFFVDLAGFLAIDGVLSAGVAGALLRDGRRRRGRREMVLGLVMLVDAAGRLTSGIVVTRWPGIASFPVTAVLFIGIMAACTAAVGLTEAWLTAREELARHGPAHQRPQFMAGPVGVASLLALAFGIAGLTWVGAPDIVRLLIRLFIAGSGVVALAMAWSHERMARARVTPFTEAGTPAPSARARPESSA